MIPFLKGLIYDPNSFANFIRVGVFVAGEVLAGLGPTSQFWWAGQVVKALALVIKAGDKNPPA